MKISSIFVGLLLALGTVSLAGCTTRTGPSSQDIVTAFYKLGLQDLKVAEAFAQYMAPDFIEHAAISEGGRVESTIAFLSGLARQSPPPRWEIVRTIAADDMVFLHVRVVLPKGPPMVLGDIFRVQNGKIAEHWDIVQPAPEHPVNPNSLF